MKLPFLLAAALLVTTSAPAEAHLVGQSLEKKVGKYLVDVGYDSLDLMEGQNVAFNATLIENAGTLQWEYAPFDSVWFQIKSPSSEAFRKVLPILLPGPVNVTYEFQEGGEYELAVAFLEGKKVLAQTSFNMPVKTKRSVQNTAKSVALVLFSLFLFLIISIIWHRRHEALYTPATNPVVAKPHRKPRKRARSRS